MRKIIINNKEIMTNYDEKSSEKLMNGEDIDGYDLFFRQNRESTKEFMDRLVNMDIQE